MRWRSSRSCETASGAYARFAAIWLAGGVIGALAVEGFQGYLIALARDFRRGNVLAILRPGELEAWYLLALLVTLIGMTVGLTVLTAWLARTRVVSPWPAATAAVAAVALVVVVVWAAALLAVALAWLGIELLGGRGRLPA